MVTFRNIGGYSIPCSKRWMSSFAYNVVFYFWLYQNESKHTRKIVLIKIEEIIVLKKCHGNHPNMKEWNELLFQTGCEPRFLITFMLISFCSLKALLIQRKSIFP
eukprot:TRINITY_DN14147_c0_g3_i1.p1 TRINITY_DN14147_c0_g3~~TRINITY_DN14147_c0_g3_i1.p1  ORF type:complete len:105 (+),score=3.44 TRINITY_DN14147_c0_g3_i1:526-840(+)